MAELLGLDENDGDQDEDEDKGEDEDEELLLFLSSSPPHELPMMTSSRVTPTIMATALPDSPLFGALGASCTGAKRVVQPVPSKYRCCPVPSGSGYQPGAGAGGGGVDDDIGSPSSRSAVNQGSFKITLRSRMEDLTPARFRDSDQ